MATTPKTKTLQTRIKNRFDTLANWQGNDVTLLQGEIALVRVIDQQLDKATGEVVNVPAILMKVGEVKDYNEDGTPKSYKTFEELPWLSALAADVYDWAKGSTAEGLILKIQTGTTNGQPVYAEGTSVTLSDWIKKLYNRDEVNAGAIAQNTEAIRILNENDTTSGSIAKAIKDAVDALDYSSSENDTTTAKCNFVTVVTQTNGKIAVKKKAIAEIDLPNISASKIVVSAESGTSGDANYIPAVMLDDKLDGIEAEIAGINSAISGGTHFIGETNEAPYIKSSKTYTKIKEVGKTTYVEKEAKAGDIVIYIAADATDPTDTTKNFEKEYISTGDSWQELGDLGRVGTLETLVGSLSTVNRVTNEYVTHVAKESGKLVIKTARPTADEVVYDKATISGNTVTTTVKDKFDSVDAAVSSIEANYVKVNNNNLVNQEGSIIIFDCGGASDFISLT